MIHIETERDPEILRQVALLLDRENRRLLDRIRDLTGQIAQLKGVDGQRLQLELDALKELLARREQALFGDSSEKRSSSHQHTQPAEPAPQRGHGPRAQPQLPLIEQVHELAPDGRRCDLCGGELSEMAGQFEDSEEVTVVRRHFTVIKHRRAKYRCACNGKVATAPGPLKLQPGGRYSVEFAVEVAASKYLDHMPLQRQCGMMGREGLVVDSQTLWDQIDVLASHLQPSYEALGDEALGSEMVNADETWWRFMGKVSKKRWWAWSVTGDRAVYYQILESRSAEAAARMLGEYRGIVMADGYSAYSALARGQPGFTLAHCWAHVRRKFIEIEDNYPTACGEIVELIGQLYAVERLVPQVGMGAPAAQQLEARQLRAQLREERSAAIVERIRLWSIQQQVLPESGLAKAIAYMTNMWPGLTRFITDARIPLDNNTAERALRDVVVGRKNHYGSHSRRGTQVAALFYSLVESAERCGVEPKLYLLKAALAAIANPGTVTLPHALLN